MLVGTAPGAIVLDTAHAETAATLRDLATAALDDRTLVVVVTDDVTREVPAGAHVLATPGSLQRVL